MWKNALHLPGYNYCGLGGNPNKAPTNHIDALCKAHDDAYEMHLSKGENPYTHFVMADKALMEGLSKYATIDPAAAALINTVFALKKKAFPSMQFHRQSNLPSNVPIGRKRSIGQIIPDYNTRAKIRRLSAEFSRLGVRRSSYKWNRDRRTVGWKRFRRLGTGRKFFKRRRRGFSTSQASERSFTKMPYRRRYRRRRRRRNYGRRRRRMTGYKRRRRTYRPYISKAISPPSTWLDESDHFLNETKFNRYVYFAPCSMFSRSQILSSWTDTGENGVPLVNDMTSDNRSYFALMSNGRIQLEFTNLNLHPFYIKVYWCIAKRESPHASETGPTAAVVQNIEDGWKNRMLDADETTVEVTSSSTTVGSNMKQLTLWESTDFRENWRCKPGKGGWLMPGDNVKFTWRQRRSRFFSAYQLNRSGYCIPGLTLVPLFFVHFSMGQETDNSQDFANLKGHIQCHCYRRITWRSGINEASLIAVTDNKKGDADIIDADAPTKFEMKEDQP